MAEAPRTRTSLQPTRPVKDVIGRTSTLEGAAAFRESDARYDGEPSDAESYCREVIRWVRGHDTEGKVRPDLACVLEAELEELRREGLRLPWR